MPGVGRGRLAVLALTFGLTAACFGQDTPVVETAEVGPATVTQTVSAPARVEAAATEEVSAQVPGEVLILAVEDGDRVRKGQMVVQLESPQLDEALEAAQQAQAALAQLPGVSVGRVPTAVPAPPNAASSVVAELDEAVLPQLDAAREALDAVQDQVEELPGETDTAGVDPGKLTSPAQAGLKAVEETYRGVRDALLAAGEAASRQQQASARQVADLAAQAAVSIEQALNATLNQAAAAQAAQADATSAQVEAQRDALVIEAPMDGVVQVAMGGRQPLLGDIPGAPDELSGLTEGLGAFGGEPDQAGPLREGARVGAGQPLFSVYDLSAMYVRADIDEVDVAQLREGQRATVLIDAFPDTEFAGVVESIRLAAEPTQAGGVAYPARIRLLGVAEDTLPRVGMTASVEIATLTLDAELAVPSRALVRREERTVVYAVRDGRAVIVPVTVGALGEERAAVTGELNPGDQVIVAGYEDLSDGDDVQTGT